MAKDIEIKMTNVGYYRPSNESEFRRKTGISSALVCLYRRVSNEHYYTTYSPYLVLLFLCVLGIGYVSPKKR